MSVGKWLLVWGGRAAGPLVGVLLGATLVTVVGAHNAPPATGVIHSCVHGGNSQLRVVGVSEACKNNETPLDWNAQGLKGDPGPQGPKGDPGPAGGSPTLSAAALVGTWKIRHISASSGQWEQVGEVTFAANGTYTATPQAYTLGGGSYTINGAPVTNGTYQVVDGSVLVLMHQFNFPSPPGFPSPPTQTRVAVALPVSVASDKIMHSETTTLSLQSLEMLAK